MIVGMTTANMKLIALSVTFPGELELNDAKLEEGEHIVKRVVALDKLHDELQEYDRKVRKVVIYTIATSMHFPSH